MSDGVMTRRSVAMPDSLWERVQRAAAMLTIREGRRVTVAEYVRRALEARLDEDEREERRAS